MAPRRRSQWTFGRGEPEDYSDAEVTRAETWDEIKLEETKVIEVANEAPMVEDLEVAEDASGLGHTHSQRLMSVRGELVDAFASIIERAADAVRHSERERDDMAREVADLEGNAASLRDECARLSQEASMILVTAEEAAAELMRKATDESRSVIREAIVHLQSLHEVVAQSVAPMPASTAWASTTGKAESDDSDSMQQGEDFLHEAAAWDDEGGNSSAELAASLGPNWIQETPLLSRAAQPTYA